MSTSTETRKRARESSPSIHASAAVASSGHAHPPDARSEEIARRLRSAQGHVGGIERMVEADAYCMDVLNQILAVQRALKKVSALVLDRHLHTCAISAIRGEDVEERERVLGELMHVFEATAKL